MQPAVEEDDDQGDDDDALDLADGEDVLEARRCSPRGARRRRGRRRRTAARAALRAAFRRARRRRPRRRRGWLRRNRRSRPRRCEPTVPPRRTGCLQPPYVASHAGHTPELDTALGAMRKLILLVCSLAAAAAVAGSAGAADPNSGTLSVERGRGVVILELRGSVLGRIANGSLRVTDQTPRDRFGAMVVGRRLTRGADRPENGAVPRTGPQLPDARRPPARRPRQRHLPLRGRSRARSRSTASRGSPARTSASTRSTEPTAGVLPAGVHAGPARGRALRHRPAAGGRRRRVGAANRAGVGAVMTQQHTILVVEDETSIASFVSAYLRNAGYGVKTAANAQGALLELAARRPRSSCSTSTCPTATASSSAGGSARARTYRSSCSRRATRTWTRSSGSRSAPTTT